MTPEQLAEICAREVPDDIHVPTLAGIFRRENITTLETARAFMRSPSDRDAAAGAGAKGPG